jgi:hypothetical protein
MGIALQSSVPNSEPTIIAFPRSPAILSFDAPSTEGEGEDDDESLPSTIPNPPRLESRLDPVVIAPIAYDPPSPGWDEVTRHNPPEAAVFSRFEATFNTRLPAAVQASPQLLGVRPPNGRRRRHRRSPALQFTIAMAFGFGIGLLIAAFYFTGGFHSLMHMR